jgi:hypothetical protein
MPSKIKGVNCPFFYTFELMSNLIEISNKMQSFIGAIGSNIDDAISNIEQPLVDINRSQMFFHSGGDDKPLIHSRTGSQFLSKQYAKKMGKTRPDIFVTGEYQKELQLFSEYENKEFTIRSDNWLEEYLPINYKNIHGIAPSNRKKAFGITNFAIGEKIRKDVLSR